MEEKDIIHRINSSHKVKSLDAELEKELNELKSELEENEMVHGITRAIR